MLFQLGQINTASIALGCKFKGSSVSSLAAYQVGLQFIISLKVNVSVHKKNMYIGVYQSKDF